MTRLCTVKFFDTNGVAADAVQNSFVFNQAGAAGAGHDAVIATAVKDFYNGANTNLPLAAYMADSLDRGAAKSHLAIYDIAGHLDGSPHGSPVYEENWQLGAITGGGHSELPHEVAACLSMHADVNGVLEEVGVTRPRARRRGRVYIGPLNSIALDNAAGGDMRIAFNLRTDLIAAGSDLIADVSGDATNPSYLAVWSRADAVSRPVTGIWVDNAVDIQRRRGVKATTRSSFET